MKIELNRFGGMAPSIEPRMLADNLATLSENTGFESGAVAPASLGAVESLEFPFRSAETQSIIRPGADGTRLIFTAGTTGEAFASLVAPSDKWGRVYFTTPYGPRFTVRDNYNPGELTADPVSYRLGMKTPQYMITVGTPSLPDQTRYAAEKAQYDLDLRTYRVKLAAYNAAKTKSHQAGMPAPVAPTEPALPATTPEIEAYRQALTKYNTDLAAYETAKAANPNTTVPQPVAPIKPAAIKAYDEAVTAYEAAQQAYLAAMTAYQEDTAAFAAAKAAYDPLFATYAAQEAQYKIDRAAYDKAYAPLARQHRAEVAAYNKALDAYYAAKAKDPEAPVSPPAPVQPIADPPVAPTEPVGPGIPTEPVAPVEAVADMVKVRYIFTFVDAYGHESAPSAPSVMVEIPFNQGFNVPLTFTAESLPDTNVSGAVRRIYRAAFDGSTSEWQFIADVPLAVSQWTDTVAPGTEGETLISLNWVPPPVLKRMVPVASNFVAGYHDNVVCYSELRLPHAWPEDYRFPLKYQVVGLKPTQNGLLVATTGKPYWAFGADPASAVPVELDANYPCLSADSMVDMGGYVIYASHDGLVAVAGQDVKLVTDQYIDRYTWLRDFAPASIVAFAHEGRYVFSVGQSWWVFDPEYGFSTLTDLRVPPSGLRQAYYDAMRDTTVLLGEGGRCYDIVSRQGSRFRQRSKIFTVAPCCFSSARVLSTQYPCTLRITTDVAGVHEYPVPSYRPIRLRSGFMATEWQLEVESGGRVTSVALAQSMQEFL